VTAPRAFRAGDTINGYLLLEDFRVVGAGLSEWSFAERGGRAYFIKRFLSPTYPDDAAPGSPTTKARKRARCAAFEAHHRGIQAAMAPLTSYGGNLIATLDFFRVGAKYYKVTEKIDLAGLEPADIARLDFPGQLVLLKTAAHSLKILHDLHIVHSDLKPSNIMIKRTELGYTTKLIDFDSSYIVGSPPPPEEIVGTMQYYSPELVRYIQGRAHPAELTEAADIFALGLIYAEYLTGVMPPFDAGYQEAATAVLNGQTLRLSPSRTSSATPAALVALVEGMLQADPSARPTVAQIHATLMGLRSAPSATTARAPLPIRSPTVPRGPAPGSRLRGKGLRVATGPAGPTAPPAAAPPASSPPAAAGRAPAPAGPPAAAPSAPAARPAAAGRLLGRLLDRLDGTGRR